MPNSTETCIGKSAIDYVCSCSNNYFYTDSECSLIQECSSAGTPPCIDSNGLIWSNISSFTYANQSNARTFCDELSEGGYTDWRLPTIDELRTLIQNCTATQTGGTCGVTDACTSIASCLNDDCGGCSGSNSYSKFGDTVKLWADTSGNGDGWFVDFSKGSIHYGSGKIYVRCLRSE